MNAFDRAQLKADDLNALGPYARAERKERRERAMTCEHVPPNRLAAYDMRQWENGQVPRA